MNQTNEHFIDNLLGDLKPVRVYGGAARYWGLYVVVSLLTVVIAAAWYGVRQPVGNFLGDPWFYGEMALVILGVAAAGYTSIEMAAPGRVTRGMYRSNLLIVSSIFFLLLTRIGWILLSGHEAHLEQENGLACVFGTVLFAIPPFLFLTVVMKLGYVVERKAATLMLLLSSLLLATIAVRFCCVTSAPLHLLVWHYLPLAVLVPAGTFCASKLFK